MFASKLRVSKAPQASQKAISPKPAQVGKQPGKVVAPKSAPKTKSAKQSSSAPRKKVTGMSNKSKLQGSPLTKKRTVKRITAR